MKPTIELLRRRLVESGVDLKRVAAEIAPRNPARSIIKLRAAFDEGKSTASTLETLRAKLGVSLEEWQAAVEEERRTECEEILAFQRRQFSPHLRIETVDEWRVSPLLADTILRRIETPPHWAELTEESEILRVVGEFIAKLKGDSALRIPIERVEAFLYRRAFDLAYRFGIDGDFRGRIDGVRIFPTFYFDLR